MDQGWHEDPRRKDRDPRPAPLSTKEKEQYVAFKSERYLEKIRYECPEIDASLKASDIINIDVSRYSNMRDINSEIMRQITESLYEQIVK